MTQSGIAELSRIEARLGRMNRRSRASVLRITLLIVALVAVMWCGWVVRCHAAEWKAAVIQWRWERAFERTLPPGEVPHMAPRLRSR